MYCCMSFCLLVIVVVVVVVMILEMTMVKGADVVEALRVLIILQMFNLVHFCTFCLLVVVVGMVVVLVGVFIKQGYLV